MNSLQSLSVPENDNTSQSVGLGINMTVALDTYWLCCMWCVVIFGHTHYPTHGSFSYFMPYITVGNTRTSIRLGSMTYTCRQSYHCIGLSLSQKSFVFILNIYIGKYTMSFLFTYFLTIQEVQLTFVLSTWH